jgi:hypothetical protein
VCSSVTTCVCVCMPMHMHARGTMTHVTCANRLPCNLPCEQTCFIVPAVAVLVVLFHFWNTMTQAPAAGANACLAARQRVVCGEFVCVFMMCVRATYGESNLEMPLLKTEGQAFETRFAVRAVDDDVVGVSRDLTSATLHVVCSFFIAMSNERVCVCIRSSSTRAPISSSSAPGPIVALV